MKYPNLKAELSRNGLHAYELAMLIGVTNVTLSHWMHGKGEPLISQALRAAECLGCGVEYLFATELPDKRKRKAL